MKNIIIAALLASPVAAQEQTSAEERALIDARAARTITAQNTAPAAPSGPFLAPAVVPTPDAETVARRNRVSAMRSDIITIILKDRADTPLTAAEQKRFREIVAYFLFREQ